MVTESRTRDIYELLGIDPTASTALAQEIYWRRVNAYLDADRSGDPTARAAIAELNEALAIILDASRRSEYDRTRERGQTPAAQSRDPERRARMRSLVVLAIVPVLGVVMWLAVSTVGPFAGVAAGIVGLVVLLLAARWATSEVVEGQSPFRLLHLVDDATVDDVNSAYQGEVNRLILQARHDRRALRKLEALDAAYLRALDAVARGSASPPRPSILGRLIRAAGDGLAAGLLRLSRALVSGLAGSAEWLRRVTGSAARAGWNAASHRQGALAPAGAEAVDIERRLQSTFREVAQRVAETREPAVSAEPSRRASLILESAAGKRSVPIGSGPLRIGADGACDLVLRREGVMPEHALAWLRDDVVMLHVVHQGAPCLVNGEPLAWAMLEDGDQVSLGDASFIVSIQE